MVSAPGARVPGVPPASHGGKGHPATAFRCRRIAFPALSRGVGTQAGDGRETGRLTALSDGIIAIAMTLLVLDLKAPGPAEDLGHALPSQGYTFLSYVLSFLILGVFWVGHHLQFSYIRRTDRLHTWINIMFLMVIAFVPFSAAVLGGHERDRVASVIYGANMAAGWALLLANWWYAARHRSITGVQSDPRLARTTLRLLWVGPLLYSAGIALSLVSTTTSIVVYAVVPILYVLWHPDRYWGGTRAGRARKERRHDTP